MQYIDAARTHALLDYPGLVEALRELFRRGVDTLERMGLSQPLPKGESNFWLILPAWQFGRNFGAKLVSVFPGNAAKGKESILGIYALFDGETGEPLAVIDGAASPVKTPLPEPIFLFLSEKISPDKLEMYKLAVKSGKREVAFPAAGKRKKDGPRPIHISTSKVDGSLYRIEASEVLEQGEYCLSPSGVNQVFCFQVY